MNANGVPFGVVVNPSSALGRGARVAGRVLAVFAASGVPAIEISGHDIAECRQRIVEACARGLRGLVLVGGDGLIGLAIQLPEVRALPVGIVPAGSGNDFARQFSLSTRPSNAVTRILAAESDPRPVDLGIAAIPVAGDGPPHEHWFAGALSIGFDAAINRRANAIRLPLGALRYHLALLAELLLLRSRPFTVTQYGSTRDNTPQDGETQTGETQADTTQTGATRTFTGLLTTVMNTRAIGGGIPLAPNASVHDGALDLVEVSHGSKLRIFSVLGLLARGKHEPLPEVTITRVDRVRIEAGDEVAYADGDPVGRGPFEVRIAPGALTLLA